MQSENCFVCRELEAVIEVSHAPLRHKQICKKDLLSMCSASVCTNC